MAAYGKTIGGIYPANTIHATETLEHRADEMMAGLVSSVLLWYSS